MSISNARWYVYVAVAALLGSAVLCTAALAGPPEPSKFSAIQGVDAQALSPEEMQGVSGQLNAYDIAAALTAEAAKLAKYPKLQAADLKLASYFQANALAINAAFQKYGVLTPCQSCK